MMTQADMDRQTCHLLEQIGQQQQSVGHASFLVPKDTEHTVFDESIAWLLALEAMGTPISFSQSQKSNIGSSIPGMGDWSTSFVKDDEDEKNKIKKEDFYDEVPPTEMADVNLSGNKDKSDEEIEIRIGSVDDLEDRKPNRDIKSTWDEPGLVNIGNGSAWGDLVKLLIMKDLVKFIR